MKLFILWDNIININIYKPSLWIPNLQEKGEYMEFLMYNALINNTNKSCYKWKRGFMKILLEKNYILLFCMPKQNQIYYII